ncbi:MAG: tetratricopeptide repeat protein, partial [Verrucomicrobia bacterium]|nr:tetratricopeptide repeat protein [Verrucomicrobiota bacterium]
MAEFKSRRALKLALEHHQAGRLAPAEALYREILAHDPGSVDGLHGLGIIALQVGQHTLAVDLIGQAVARAPGHAAIHANLGEAYRNLHRLDEAVASFRRALALQPKLPSALNNLANALAVQGKVDEAIACCQRAIALQPNFANAHNNLGICLAGTGRFEEAIAAYERAIRLKPDLADAHNNLGSALIRRRQLDEALACYQRALALRPGSAEVHDNLGGVFKEQGRLDEALACYRQALVLRPDYSAAHSDLIFVLHYRFGDDAGAIDAELGRWNIQHARPLGRCIPPHLNDRSPDRRLRIGYLSPDFRSHPVGWFLRPLFAHHDRQAFEFFCYANVQRPDHFTTELRAGVDGWRDLAGQTDQQVADLIRADRIDILVDLALHTEGNRLLVCARKPAPVQATYLAYPGNSGLDTIDYRLTDPHLDPSNQETRPGPEQPFRLPDTYWCYQPVVHPAPAVTPLPALAAGYITFGCLNNFGKVTPAALAAWCRLLAAVPNAHLLLHTHPGSHRSRLHDLFARNGIDPGRLRFSAQVPAERYFQLYQSIDIGLDPFPFPGGTTTCDALWMGVPVITLAGPTPVTRGGFSVLS